MIPEAFFRPETVPSLNGSAPADPVADPVPVIMDITPELAEAWDRIDVIKRKIYQRKVDEFARDMKAGRWNLNGETIKRTYDGGILDGKHRMRAIIQSRATIRSVVVEGLPHEAQKTVDLGTPRSFADQLTMAGQANATLYAAITKRAWRWMQGYRGSSGPNPTPGECEELSIALPILGDATVFAARAVKRFRFIRGTVWGTSYLIFSEKSEIGAQAFLQNVYEGAALETGHPALTLRNRMLRADNQDERLKEHEQLAMMIVAWNAFRVARKISMIKMPAGGLKPSNFPKPE